VHKIWDMFSLRGMKGEDFEGLNLEGLQQLEKSLESGLKRVIEMKVCTMIIC